MSKYKIIHYQTPVFCLAIRQRSEDLKYLIPRFGSTEIQGKHVRYEGTKLPLAHKNFASNECVLQYLASLQLKMNQRKHPPLHEKDIK